MEGNPLPPDGGGPSGTEVAPGESAFEARLARGVAARTTARPARACAIGHVCVFVSGANRRYKP